MKLTVELTEEEAMAFATVIRRQLPPPEISKAWYQAIDKISPQLPESHPDRNAWTW